MNFACILYNVTFINFRMQFSGFPVFNIAGFFGYIFYQAFIFKEFLKYYVIQILQRAGLLAFLAASSRYRRTEAKKPSARFTFLASFFP